MNRIMRTAALCAGMLSVAAIAPRARAQDIVMAGRMHGVELPASARRILAKDPHAFEFRRAMKSKLRAVQRSRGTVKGLLRSYGPAASATGSFGAPLRGTRIGTGPVVNGTERVVVLPILYSNTAAEPWPVSDLQRRLFDGPSSTETLTQLYNDMSRGNLTMTGTVAPWTRVPGADTSYEGPAGNNGFDGPGLWNLLDATLLAADASIDFSQYDSDHDGYVDLVAFVQPESGGECGNNNMWSHRWVIQGAADQAGDTATVNAGGFKTNDGVIISDYVLQPALDCDDRTPIPIGVFAHEFGHALGLPDLYDTKNSPTSEGIGYWGLMGAGNWNQPVSPSEMEAWSMMQLGWRPVQTISADSLHVVMDPIETTGSIIRLNVPGTSEYFLLENRQRLGTDQYLKGTGLLIWHVDSATVANNWDVNAIQNTATHKGLDLVEANGRAGLDQLGYRGGAGDPFPGSAGVHSWTPSTASSSNGYAMTSGISITNIVESGGQISFDISFGPTGPVVVKWGDVDGDGVVGPSDYLAIYGCLNTSSCGSVPSIVRGDVDGDGAVTLRDAFIIHSYVVGGVDVSAYRTGQPWSATSRPVTYPTGGTANGSKPPVVLQSAKP